ncbi:hypothetical protein H2203_005453 [Taxawa tesnikishii (nom. ined.)]|nr:hypothetical protein H2203_005453 [Dothideales sp. JES 119]
MKLATILGGIVVFASVAAGQVRFGAKGAGDVHFDESKSNPTAIVKRRAPSEAFYYILGNASLLLGWQLAGVAPTMQQAQMNCKDIGTLGHGKWAAINYVPELIKGKFTHPYLSLRLRSAITFSQLDTPICQTANAVADPVAASANVTVYATNIFVLQAINSFAPGSTDSLVWLCSHLMNAVLTVIGLEAERSRESICEAAGFNSNNMPVVTDPVLLSHLTTSVHDAVIKAASNLYAYEFVLTSNTSADLYMMCSQYPYVQQNLAEEGLDTDIIRSVICGQEAPLTIEQGAAAVVQWSSEIYLQELLYAGTVSDWLQYLCRNLHVPSMNNVGLNGTQVQSGICAAAA